MKRRSLLLLTIALALVIAAGAIAWTLFFRPIDVLVSQAEGDVLVQVFGLGTVEARVTSKVGFKASGVLVELRADVGDRVPKGAVLARLDDREQTARVGRAKAASEQADANLQRAMANVQKAQANYANAKTINERRQKLVQSSTTSVETAETAKTAQDAALADVNLAESDVAVARAAIGDAKAQLQQESATLDFHPLASPYDAMVTARLK
ncbi:MAG: efflux RND transporter periplasmic adaptor subunit, partial [Pseudolabrys sp.]